LKLADDEFRITGVITHADDHPSPVRAVVLEWDLKSNQVFSGDQIDLTAGGTYLFFVKSPLNQHVAA
jgi:hypothetical protein